MEQHPEKKGEKEKISTRNGAQACSAAEHDLFGSSFFSLQCAVPCSAPNFFPAPHFFLFSVLFHARARHMLFSFASQPDKHGRFCFQVFEFFFFTHHGVYVSFFVCVCVCVCVCVAL